MTYSWTTPVTFTDGAGNGPTAAELDTLAADVGFLHQEFPIRAILDHRNSDVTNGNALAITISSTQDYGFYATQNPAADADAFEQSFLLAAGTYTIHYLGQTYNGAGKIDWSIDGTIVQAGQDWFSGGVVANIEKTTTSVVVAATGRHVITGTVNGKNASSAGYAIRFTLLWFEPESGDVA